MVILHFAMEAKIESTLERPFTPDENGTRKMFSIDAAFVPMYY